MTEEDVAKMAFAEIVGAIKGFREDMTEEQAQKFSVSFPNSIIVNGNEYKFIKTIYLC